MLKKNYKKSVTQNELSFEDDYEESCFNIAPLGTPISSFSFSNDAVEVTNSTNSTDVLFHKQDTEKLIDNSEGKPNANGLTPPIDGEAFNIKRCYTFRKSTIKKLNELKAKHPDVNAYLSTILDAAINHYYEHIISEKVAQKEEFF